MPTREDVDLARAAIDRGFLTIKESVKCLEIQRDHEANGRQVSLDRVFVEANFLTEGQVGMLKESLAKSAALRHVGPYEILSRVGAGGMGTVYKAKDTKAERVVALKILSPAHANNKEYIQRFLREAHASGQLSHPNIVQGFDAGESGGQYYFAMEFIDGITVGDMLKEGRALAEQQALDIGIQIAKALEHAEAHHLVHRDIKPDNIMITKDGTAKLADLGLARLTTVIDSQIEQKSFGTAYYASPEQCQGLTNEVDTQSDMYSFGATLFHMLAGRVPFDDESAEAIMARHIEDRRPYLKDLNVQLSHGISKIVRKLMAVNKKDRYATMPQVVKDLTLVRMGRSPKLGEGNAADSNANRYRSPTGSWRIKSPAKRKKIIIAVVVSSSVLALILLGLFFAMIFRQTGPPVATPGSGYERNDQESLNQKAEEAFRKDIQPLIDKGAAAPQAELYRKLAEFRDGEYKGTLAATRASNLAISLLQNLEKEAQPFVEKRKEDAAALEKQLKFHAAMDELDKLPVDYTLTSPARQMEAAKNLVAGRAAAKFKELSEKADGLDREKKFQEAVDVYASIVGNFGIPQYVEKANARIKEIKQEIEAARLEELRKQQEEAARVAAAAAKEKARQDKLALKEAIRTAKELAGQTKYADAAKALRDAAAASADAGKGSLDHAAADIEAAVKLMDAIHKAAAALKDKDVAIILRSGDRMEGAIFGVGESGVSLQIEARGVKTLHSFPWGEISVEGFKALIEAGRTLTPSDHYAFASLFFFTGFPEKAASEIQIAANDPAEKAAADTRTADFKMLTDLAAYTGN